MPIGGSLLSRRNMSAAAHSRSGCDPTHQFSGMRQGGILLPLASTGWLCCMPGIAAGPPGPGGPVAAIGGAVSVSPSSAMSLAYSESNCWAIGAPAGAGEPKPGGPPKPGPPRRCVQSRAMCPAALTSEYGRYSGRENGELTASADATDDVGTPVLLLWAIILAMTDAAAVPAST